MEILSNRDRNLYTRVYDKSWERGKNVRNAIIVLVKKTSVFCNELSESEKVGMLTLIKQHMVTVKKDSQGIEEYSLTPGAKS